MLASQTAAYRTLVELIQKKGGEITPRDLFRCGRKYQPTDVAEKALQVLVDSKLGKWKSRKSKTKTIRVFHLFSNPC